LLDGLPGKRGLSGKQFERRNIILLNIDMNFETGGYFRHYGSRLV
jgi:hypothetical protein